MSFQLGSPGSPDSQSQEPQESPSLSEVFISDDCFGSRRKGVCSSENWQLRCSLRAFHHSTTYPGGSFILVESLEDTFSQRSARYWDCFFFCVVQCHFLKNQARIVPSLEKFKVSFLFFSFPSSILKPSYGIKLPLRGKFKTLKCHSPEIVWHSGNKISHHDKHRQTSPSELQQKYSKTVPDPLKRDEHISPENLFLFVSLGRHTTESTLTILEMYMSDINNLKANVFLLYSKTSCKYN